ncbi:MAG TPA: alpha/beta hydrolase [Acidimicrobiales bacterium]|nr:alpha/beta hydrolase [Acidimicrobiales bacterium]
MVIHTDFEQVPVRVGDDRSDGPSDGPSDSPSDLVQGLPGRVCRAGATSYRFVPGPDGAPTVVLLHGWTSTADVTWHGVYGPLSRHFSIIAPDLRGHGVGPRGRRSRLTDLASDVVNLMQALDPGPVVLVGYSMGGAAAQIVARQRPDLLLGMVVCASASPLCSSRAARLGSALLRVGSRLGALVPDTPLRLLASAVMRVLFGDTDFERWVRARTSRHSWSEVLSLGADVVSFDSRGWIGDLEVPSAVVVTTADRFVSPRRQHLLATSLEAPAVCVDGDHNLCLARPVEFAEALRRACHSVVHLTVPPMGEGAEGDVEGDVERTA